MKTMEGSRFGLILALLAGALTLGLTSVWLNIGRMDMAYDIRNMERELDRRKTVMVKLEVERNNLLSPYRLGQLAEELGLVVPEPGQIRRIVDQ
ncbi:hypothetical protein [Salidesulfovibrio brasiliensis]|uniref:hypothetical protein n=1 Tax=Salidesulfovibrio brasiliensis TaxID=221711 RepID=UPI0006D17A12|nr:hypothetical protein [Salidesulfovibrio brasiliensis]